MRAICKARPQPGAELGNVPTPRIAADEILIKVHRASICGSDLPIYQWNSWAPSKIKTPLVFGHEFCGFVADCGRSAAGFKKGDFVSVESHIFCGTCFQCKNGQKNLCQNLKTIGIDCPGGFAEFAAVPARCAWKHKDQSLTDIGSLMEPLGNAVYATLIENVAGRSLLVLGCGPQGLFAIQVAKASSAKSIIAIEASSFRRKLAEKMGADIALDFSERGILLKIHKAAGNPGGVDVVLEMSGNPAAIQLGFEAVRKGGRYTAFGLSPRPVSVNWDDDIVLKGIRIYGIFGRDIYRTWEMTDHLLRSRSIDVRPVITHVFPMKDFKKAFEIMASPDKKCGKVVIQIA